MSNVARVLGAGGNTQGIPLSVEDVFSTFLYKGNGSAQTITNNIDLSGEGGLVWAKQRTGSSSQHALFDTENGTLKALASSNNAALATETSVTAFNSNGFSLAAFNNTNNEDYVSWTFRKAPKFFDVVTYTGDGQAGRTVSHSLGSAPGMIIVKCTSSGSTIWPVYHRGVNNGSNPENYFLKLEDTAGQADYHYFNDTAPTSTEFTVTSHGDINGNGATFVAYLFAHNDGDADFGADGNADIIKCGNYSAVSAGTEISLGFEPQFIVIKKSSAEESWYVYDAMRGVVTGGDNSQDKKLRWNTANPESAVPAPIIAFSANGFILESTDNEINGSGGNYVYMAIRRGDMATPTTATDVFAIDNQSASSAPFLTSNFPVDMVLRKDTAGGNTEIMTRLTQNKGLIVNSTGGESTDTVAQFDFSDGCLSGTSQDTSRYGWMWKRARGYFDVQTFTLGSSSNREVEHNLAAVPEMIWWKERSGSSYWMVWHKSFTSSQYMTLHLTSAILTSSDIWGTSSHTSTGWYMKESAFGSSSNTCISFTFATLAGVSKVGTVSHTSGSPTNVDCGFTSGARFVLIKQTDDSGAWYIFDTVRGIIPENDQGLYLNTTTQQQAADWIDPLDSGFTMTSGAWNSGTYLFYAIA